MSDWRRAVFAARVTDKTKVLLLYLADHMKANRYVSIPRREMSRALGKSERRIDERIAEAIERGLLDTVVHGRKYVTAVYVGTFPDALSATETSALKGAETVALKTPNQPLSATDGGRTTTKAQAPARSPKPATPHSAGSGERHRGDESRGTLPLAARCPWHLTAPDELCRNCPEEAAS